MAASGKEKLIREYATGEITWHSLQQCGFDTYVQVLAGLGALGLRRSAVPMEELNAEARCRGRVLIREALRAQH